MKWLDACMREVQNETEIHFSQQQKPGVLFRSYTNMRYSEYVIGVRDCPYGICCPWVRGGWDLDTLGKFFRRRRRRPRLRVPRSTNLVPT